MKVQSHYEVYKGKYSKRTGYTCNELVLRIYPFIPRELPSLYKFRALFSLFGLVVLTINNYTLTESDYKYRG